MNHNDAMYMYKYIYIYIYIYIYSYRVIMKVKKTFLLDTFRRMSSTVKVFCSDTNLKFLILFDILQVYPNKSVVI